MRTRILLITTLAIALMMAMTTMTLAKKPDNPGKPTTTTTAPQAGWTCEERVANGAAWVLGSYENETYTVTDLPACIDIVEPEHLESMAWTVRLDGEATRFKGLKMVFEQGVHGLIYGDFVVEPESGRSATFDNAIVWEPTIGPADEPLVFVAMPRNGDQWIPGTTITLTASPANR